MVFCVHVRVHVCGRFTVQTLVRTRIRRMYELVTDATKISTVSRQVSSTYMYNTSITYTYMSELGFCRGETYFSLPLAESGEKLVSPREK